MNQLTPIHVIIVDDHELYAEGLALLLGRREPFVVDAIVTDGKNVLQSISRHQPDVLLLDLHLPDIEPEELIKLVREQFPALPVIYLTMMRGTRNVHKMLRYNIQGYVLKNAKLEELIAAIEKVREGGTYFTPEINVSADDDAYKSSINIQENSFQDLLTKRELEVLRLICKEYSNAEIAEQLFLSIGTIETHRKNIINKLGVNNTVGLVKFAIRNNLV